MSWCHDWHLSQKSPILQVLKWLTYQCSGKDSLVFVAMKICPRDRVPVRPRYKETSWTSNCDCLLGVFVFLLHLFFCLFREVCVSSLRWLSRILVVLKPFWATLLWHRFYDKHIETVWCIPLYVCIPFFTFSKCEYENMRWQVCQFYCME